MPAAAAAPRPQPAPAARRAGDRSNPGTPGSAGRLTPGSAGGRNTPGQPSPSPDMGQHQPNNGGGGNPNHPMLPVPPDQGSGFSGGTGLRGGRPARGGWGAFIGLKGGSPVTTSAPAGHGAEAVASTASGGVTITPTLMTGARVTANGSGIPE